MTDRLLSESTTVASTTRRGVVELAADGEATAGTVVQGSDARLSDMRTPRDHHLEFLAGGTRYVLASEAMTLDLLVSGGTGILSYDKALAVDTTSFSSTTLPVTLAAGDVLRVTCSMLDTYKALVLRRVA